MSYCQSRKKGPPRRTIGFIREPDGQISHGFESWSDRDPKLLQFAIQQSSNRCADSGPQTAEHRSAFSEPDKDEKWHLEDFGDDLPLDSDGHSPSLRTETNQSNGK
jgi:hypothetical protein